MINTATAITDITKGIDLDAALWDRTPAWSISRAQVWGRLDNYCDDPSLDPDDFDMMLAAILAYCILKGVLRD